MKRQEQNADHDGTLYTQYLQCHIQGCSRVLLWNLAASGLGFSFLDYKLNPILVLCGNLA